MLQRVWGWRYGLLQVLVVLSSAVAVDCLYSLVPPEMYVVFGGDLEVVFHMPGNVSLPNAFVWLQGQRPRDEAWLEITTMGLPLGKKTGTIAAACGVVEFAGKYSLTMFMQVGGPVLTEVTFYTIWPPLVLRLPQSHYALTSTVTLQIESGAKCDSRLHREFLTLELYFQRVDDVSNPYAKLPDARAIAASNFSSIAEEHTTWTYACEIFDLDGSYQALLRSSSGTILAVSNVMALTFSASYHLTTRGSSVFPCQEGSTLDVFYSHPPCGGVDKFRVYKLQKEAAGSAAAPLERVYVAEFETDPDKTNFRFNCSLFDKLAMGYCFVYVTISQHRTVAEQKQLCLPSQPNAVLPQDGGWSPWTDWTACSVTCGSGQQSRFRMCNKPSPEHGGRYCSGPAVQWTHCTPSCPGSIPLTPLRSPTFDPRCYCGCTQTTQAGEIIASGRCKGLATWIIKTVAGQQVQLTFRYYDISYDRQWVKVRDGESESDELLFFSRAQTEPSDVTSSTNVMRVELMTEVTMTSLAEATVFPRNASLPIHVRGFIASYSSTAQDVAKLQPTLFRHVEPSVMDDDVTIVGIVVCAVVAAAVVVFAAIQRVYWRRIPKYSMANSEESPAHVVHSSSGQSSQPSSPGPQVQVDMDIPLTGGSGAARRKSSSGQRAISRASSISSTCSAGLKRIRSRSENAEAGSISGGGGGKCADSPKPSTKDYNSLGSPASNNVSPENHVHDANFFRGSPILKQVAPRSPKVHPHRLKASPGTPSSPVSSSITKHELLTRKRQERKGSSTPAREVDDEREITGSSGSSTLKPDSNTTTTKAEINFTKLAPPGAVTNLRSPMDSKMPISARLRVPADSLSSKRLSQGDRTPAAEEIPLIDSTEDLQLSHKTDSKSNSPNEETSFIYPKAKARRPTSLTESYSLETIESRGSKSRTPKSPAPVAGKPSAMEERQTLLPKPDGQSPKSPREESEGAGAEDKQSKSSSPSKSSLGGKSNKTLSPTRSIATPELEYDDFIMDDPLSYFEYDELSRLNWTGTEKIGKTGRKDT